MEDVKKSIHVQELIANILTVNTTANMPAGFTVSDLTIENQAQGDILYFNGTNWVRLAAGTSGTFLKTQGAAANPIWASAPTPSDLNIASQAQGDILYFNGTNWVRLAAGTAGYVLQTNGAGQNPSWVALATVPQCPIIRANDNVAATSSETSRTAMKTLAGLTFSADKMFRIDVETEANAEFTGIYGVSVSDGSNVTNLGAVTIDIGTKRDFSFLIGQLDSATPTKIKQSGLVVMSGTATAAKMNVIPAADSQPTLTGSINYNALTTITFDFSSASGSNVCTVKRFVVTEIPAA